MTNNTLSIDLGGTAIKMMVLDAQGEPLTDYISKPTPQPATVNAVCMQLHEMIQDIQIGFDRISAGFPGVVKNGIIHTAVNMDPSWLNLDFQETLQTMTQCPAQIANDADIQGYGAIHGNGVELVITLGTGLGSALFIHGILVPNLELAHHPFYNNQTYEMLLGMKAREAGGIAQWNAYLEQAIALWDRTFNFDYLYLGGGYAQSLDVNLPPNAIISDNIAGVLGGIKLWGLG